MIILVELEKVGKNCKERENDNFEIHAENNLCHKQLKPTKRTFLLLNVLHKSNLKVLIVTIDKLLNR